MNVARTAAEWDLVHTAGEGVGRMISAEELIKFRRFVGPGPGQAVIDAGCGKGAFSHQLWRYGCDVTGIDWSAEALRRARRSLSAGQTRRLRYLQHDLNTDGPPEVESSSVDLVVCRFSLAHLGDRERFMSQARDWLKPGGIGYVMTFVREKLPPRAAHAGLAEEEIAVLDRGWGSAVRYGLGRAAVVVLRKADPAS